MIPTARRFHQPFLSLRIALVCGIAMSAACLSGFVNSSTAAEAFPRIQESVIAPDRPLPKGNWRPIAADEYRALLKAARPLPAGPGNARIERSEYAATFDPDTATLRGGTTTATVNRSSEKPDFLTLDPLNLAISQLRWADHDAVWGTTRDGRIALLVDRESGELQGRWSLKGRRVLNNTEFDLQIASSLVARLTLRIPRDRSLKCSVGDVHQPVADAESGWMIWRVDLGKHSACRLTIEETRLPVRTRQLVLYEQTTSLTVRQEALDATIDLNLEVLRTPLRRLSFWLPGTMRVYSMTYGSDDFALSWKQSEKDGRRNFDIDLPDPLIGRSRQIRIQGTSTGRVAGKLRLPQLTVDHAVFLAGQLNVEIAPPLLLQDVSVDGFRQIDIRDGRGLRFQQQSAAGSVIVDVGIPRPVLSSRVLNHVTANADAWSLVAEIVWQDRWKSAFATRCRLPDQWEVTDVRPKPGLSPVGLTTWNIARTADGSRILSIEFNEAISDINQSPIQVFARRQPVAPDQPVDIPVIEPLDCDKLQMLLVTSLPSTLAPALDAEAHFDRIQTSTLSEIWKAPDAEDFVRDAEIARGDGQLSLWYSDSYDATGRFQWRETRGEADSNGASTANGESEHKTAGSRTKTSATGASRGKRQPADHATDARARSSVPAVDVNAVVKDANSFATAELKSLLQFQTGGFNYHSIKYSLDHGTNPGDFRFALPAPARLSGIEVNAHTVSPVITGEIYTVPQLPDGTIQSITIHYTTPSINRFLWNRTTIVVPAVSQTLLTFRWQFAVPPGMQPAASPNGLVFEEPIAEVSWSQRLFGPLGRPSGMRIFNPFDGQSWKRIVSEAQSTDHKPLDAGRNRFAPMGWTRIQASADEMPSTLDLEICNSNHVLILAHIGMFVSLTIGFLLRIFRSRLRGNIGGYWLAVCGVAACLVPGVYAEIAGGCLIGTILATLFPRSLLLPRPLGDQPQIVVSLDRTKSFQRVPANPLILFSLLLATNAIAQELSADKEPAETPNANVTPTADGGELFEVLIPNPKLASSDTVASLVYVPDALLNRLHALRSKRSKPKYLISSAAYRGDVGSEGAIDLHARFQVTVLDSEPTARVHFPISDARLGGLNPCLVDGKPQPVLRAQDEAGFEVDLRKPARATADPGGSKTFDVEFVLHPTSVPVPGGSGFRIGIPTILASNLSLKFTKMFPTVKIENSRGETTADSSGLQFVAQIGKSTALRVLWSAQQIAVQPPASLDAAISCLIEAHPTQLKHRYRVAYRVVDGRAGFVSWRLPKDAVIRDVLLDGEAVDYQFLSQPAADPRLLIEFAEPRTTGFKVDVSYTLPIRSPQKQIVLAKRKLFEDNDQPDSLRVTSEQIGVGTTAGFQLKSLTGLTDEIIEIPTDVFMKRWDGSDVVWKPVVAYELSRPAKLTFELVALEPHRQVRLNQIGRISKSRLDWTFTAEIKTTNAAAFQHTLVLNQGLKIHSISVVEDEAERLAHWSQIGDRLVLFLKDRTLFLADKSTGIQNVVLHGSVPLSLGETVLLPSIGFEDATLVDAQVSKLRLYRDIDLAVQLVDAESLTPLQTPIEARSEDANKILLGQFEFPPTAPSPGIRVSQLNQKTTVRSAMLLERKENASWALRQRMQFQRAGTRIGLVQLRIPSQISGTFQLDADKAKRREEKLDDGSIQITLIPHMSAKQSMSVVVTSELTEPKENEWTIPQVSAIDVEQVENLLILAPSDRFDPVNAVANQVDRATMPASIRSDLLSEIASPSTVFRGDATAQWVLARRQIERAINQRALIPLVSSQVSVQKRGLQIGRTVIFADTPSDYQLLMHWPAGAVLRAVFVGGRHVAVSGPQSGKIRVPTGPDAGVRTITCFWSRQQKAKRAQLARIALDVPFPRGAYVNRSVLTFVPRQGTYVFAGGSLDAIDPLDGALTYAEGLLETNQAHQVNTSGIDSTLWSLLNQARESIQQQMSQLTKTHAQEAVLIGRFKQFEEGFQLLESSMADTTGPLPDSDRTGDFSRAYLANTLVGVPGLLSVKLATAEPDSTHNVWTLQRRPVSLLLGVFGFAAVLLIFRRLLKLEIGEWLYGHQPISWALLGIIWWLCLSPSVVGVALIAISVIWAIRQRMNPQAASDAIILEVSHVG